jgi:hypothetical protein
MDIFANVFDADSDGSQEPLQDSFGGFGLVKSVKHPF